MNAVIYIHGKGGNAEESAHYAPLFPGCNVSGLDYRTFTPWETGPQIREEVEGLAGRYENVVLIANSIGAYFSMCSGIDRFIRNAYFISPVVDMEKLICGMMALAGVTEDELRSKGVISVPFGEDLSWDYLRYVREHPVVWDAPTRILYGSRDTLTPFETVKAFADGHHAPLTVMENGEHWFHTEEQMRFLDRWIRESVTEDRR